MERTGRGAHHLVAVGVVLVMVGLIPIAMHSTGAGYEVQGFMGILAGIGIAMWGSSRERSAERRADRDRAYAQFSSVRSSPFDVRRPADIVMPRGRIVVPSFRIDLHELEPVEYRPHAR